MEEGDEFCPDGHGWRQPSRREEGEPEIEELTECVVEGVSEVLREVVMVLDFDAESLE